MDNTLKPFINIFGTFAVTRQQRQCFINGQLSEEWHDQFPAIFDEDDLQLAKSQKHNHFFEWLAAILIYNSTGYYSLIEKYQFTKDHHKRKREIIERINSPVLNTALVLRGNYGGVQSPDLLVYAPDLSDWFFCEVKGGNDRLSNNQKLHFQALQNLTGKPIQLVKFYYTNQQK